jgi:hypothetical protein
MYWHPPPISATKLATDYVSGAHEFLDKVVDLCARLENVGDTGTRRQEACAALWAAMVTAIEASSFNEEDRKQLLPLILDAYLPYWEKHCGAHVRPQDRCSRYLQARDAQSHLRTAVAMVDSLLEALAVPDTNRTVYSRLFSALFAHRILGDVQYFNGIKSNYSLK